MFSKQKDKSPETDPNEWRCYLSDREFKITVRNIITVVRRARHKLNENYNKEKILKSSKQKPQS